MAGIMPATEIRKVLRFNRPTRPRPNTITNEDRVKPY
jgi:hypothetical protein